MCWFLGNRKKLESIKICWWTILQFSILRITASNSEYWAECWLWWKEVAARWIGAETGVDAGPRGSTGLRMGPLCGCGEIWTGIYENEKIRFNTTLAIATTQHSQYQLTTNDNRSVVEKPVSTVRQSIGSNIWGKRLPIAATDSYREFWGV